MKKYQSETIICILLILTLLFLISISSTYAKYTTTVNANSSTTVAKFKVSENVNQIFNLFNTVYEENGKDNSIIDVDIVPGRIAPGTEGMFTVKILNDSDVTVDYSIELAVSDEVCQIPIEFSSDDVNYGRYVSGYNCPGKLNINQEKSETFYWRWKFDEYNEIDTNLGLNPEKLTVTVKTVFTQAN